MREEVEQTEGVGSRVCYNIQELHQQIFKITNLKILKNLESHVNPDLQEKTLPTLFEPQPSLLMDCMLSLTV